MAQAAHGDASLVWISSLTWNEDHETHGGYSGLHVSENGGRFIAITDRGDIAQGTFTRTHGKLTSAKTVEHDFLKPAPWSQNLGAGGRATEYNSDAEGLAVASDGSFWVSFEGHHRLRHFTQLGATPQGVRNHPDFKKFQDNSGMEALAIDSKNRLYTLPERSGKWTRPFPVYRKAGKDWERWTSLPRRDRFLPTGADIGPDGRFYLLERQFEFLRGFATRIRRFDLTETGFTNEVTLLTSGFGAYGNTESISVWNAPDGSLRLTLLTDDNFNLLQSTRFHEFALQ